MPTPNPFFAAQTRIRTLLKAASYFASLRDEQLLTEEVANLEFEVWNKLLPTGFGGVITTAEGRSSENQYEALKSGEDFTVSFSHNPTLDADHNILDAVWAAICALQGQAATDPASPVGRPGDFFSVTGHKRRFDAPENVVVHEIYVSCVLGLI